MPQILVVPTSLILRHTLLGITCLVSLCDRGLLLFRQCRRIHCSAHFSICICLRDIFPVFAREHSCAAGMLTLELADLFGFIVWGLWHWILTANMHYLCFRDVDWHICTISRSLWYCRYPISCSVNACVKQRRVISISQCVYVLALHLNSFIWVCVAGAKW